MFGTDTKRLGLHLSPLTGSATIEFLIRRNTLGTGKYFINASFMDSVEQHIHDLTQATTFNSRTTKDQPHAPRRRGGPGRDDRPAAPESPAIAR